MMVWAESRRAWRAGLAAVVVTLVFSAVLQAIPGTPTLFSPVVAGQQVTLSWSAVPGATAYRLGIGITPGVVNYSEVVGPVTTLTFRSPFVGTGYVRVQALDSTGAGAPSNEVTLVVGGGATAVPAAPVNLQATPVGSSVHFSWGPGMGGGLPLGVILEAGTFPGGANMGAVPLPISTGVTVPGVPPGIYYVRAYAANAAGRSLPSNEVLVNTTPGGGCTVPEASTLSASVSGSTVSFAWAPVAGVAGYRLEVTNTPGGPTLVSDTFGAGTTSASYPGAPPGTYYARIVGAMACGAETTSVTTSFTVAAPPPGSGPRTPNPPPGQRLPLPNMSSVAEAVGRAYPAELRNSCVEHGGNNAWLFRLVQELRRYDTRWGLNWKRGRVGDMSQDIVNYNFSSDPDEGTTNVYIIDVIGGHCGGSPGAAWIDNTEATRAAGTIGRWTLQPYIAAGGQP